MTDFPKTEQVRNEIKRRKSKIVYAKLLWNTIASLAVVAAFAILAATVFLPVLKVTGSSMQNTLANGELVMCRKSGSFKRGDVIAFYYNNKILIKRVIAVPGEVINIDSKGNVYINEKRIKEDYVLKKSLGECDIEFPYQVPESKLFVMGDNRAQSIDSRSSDIGCIYEEAIIGKATAVIWPIKSFRIIN